VTDISVTVTAVVSTITRSVITALAGATITAGQTVYTDAATGKWLLADCDSATVPARTPVGIALNGGALNQPITVKTLGDITFGAVLTAGVGYYQSPVAGGIAPIADVLSGDLAVFLGFAKSTTVLALDITAAAVVL